jgi:hypothetical protein
MHNAAIAIPMRTGATHNSLNVSGKVIRAETAPASHNAEIVASIGNLPFRVKQRANSNDPMNIQG